MENKKVSIYAEDSIKYLKNASKKYNYIVIDTPLCMLKEMYKGYPDFWQDVVRVCSSNAIIIFNVESKYMNIEENFFAKIEKITTKKVKDCFFVARGKTVKNTVCYAIVVLGEETMQ